MATKEVENKSGELQVRQDPRPQDAKTLEEASVISKKTQPYQSEDVDPKDQKCPKKTTFVYLFNFTTWQPCKNVFFKINFFKNALF